MILATICTKCRGTILARSQNGSARGTCNCQPTTAPRAVRSEGWEPSGPPRMLRDLARHSVVRFLDGDTLRRIERTTKTTATLAKLEGSPDPVVVPLTTPAIPYTYQKRRA